MFVFTSSFGDSLTANGVNYHNVIVVEGENLFYILNPMDGSIKSVAKDDVEDLVIDTPDKNGKLKSEWERKRTSERNILLADTRRSSFQSDNSVEKGELLKPTSVLFSEKKEGIIRIIKEDDNNVRRGDRKIANRISEDVGVRLLPGSKGIVVAHNAPQYAGFGSYPYSGSNVLPKVVLRNPPVSGAIGNYGMPGMMGFGYPGRGIAPTYGGRPFPMQGGYFGGFGDVTIISNISDMFFNIDDRIVGEFPYSFYYLYPASSNESSLKYNRKNR